MIACFYKYGFKLQIFILVLFLLIFKTSIVMATEQYGPFAKVFYTPFGTSFTKLPYTEDQIGSIAGRPDSAKTTQTVSGYSIAGGYFYNYLQGSIFYKSNNIKNQLISEPSQSGKTRISADIDYYGCKFGYRYSNPGDTSFQWLYFGLKSINLTSKLAGTELTGFGYIIGINSFNSFGLKQDYEFVINFDLNFGLYKNAELSLDISSDNTKKNTFTSNFSIGVGIQFEPSNLTVLLKMENDYEYLKFKGNYNDSEYGYSIYTLATYVGVECIYQVPNYKYNKKD